MEAFLLRLLGEEDEHTATNATSADHDEHDAHMDEAKGALAIRDAKIGLLFGIGESPREW